MLRSATLEELYQRNGKALGMDFVDEEILKNESGMCTFSVGTKERLCGRNTVTSKTVRSEDILVICRSV